MLGNTRLSPPTRASAAAASALIGIASAAALCAGVCVVAWRLRGVFIERNEASIMADLIHVASPITLGIGSWAAMTAYRTRRPREQKAGGAVIDFSTIRPALLRLLAIVALGCGAGMLVSILTPRVLHTVPGSGLHPWSVVTGLLVAWTMRHLLRRAADPSLGTLAPAPVESRGMVGAIALAVSAIAGIFTLIGWVSLFDWLMENTRGEGSHLLIGTLRFLGAVPAACCAAVLTWTWAFSYADRLPLDHKPVWMRAGASAGRRIR